MTPLRYPAGSEARRVAVEAELLATLALGIRTGQPVPAELPASIAERLRAAAARIARIEEVLDAIVADAMEQEHHATREAAVARGVAQLRAIAANPLPPCATPRDAATGEPAP